MIVITGAAGFIGSCLASELNSKGIENLILVDDFSKEEKKRNFHDKKFKLLVDREEFKNWFLENEDAVDFVYHIGARTDTTEFDVEIFNKLNLNFSKDVWNICTESRIPLVYASSAATYGLGEYGYKDDHAIVEKLKPLNPYGDSKNDFDKWVLQQTEFPPHWYGVKFFNVYGPNEFHKGRMASVIFHAFNQINATGGMKLFRSHNPEYKDGEQTRDFIYVKDLLKMLEFLRLDNPESGLYNIGTGNARTFLDLTKATFAALNRTENISFIDTPEDIRDKYQYFTEADMEKIRKVGYSQPFYTLEEGVTDYVQNYLIPNKIY
ncbi:MAG: ADP-glyceromanno-heptose 6-epimerase [Crocinitomicaceae bacterium]